MDELVKALRETDFGDTCVLCEHEDMCKCNDCIIIQAADAIEELICEVADEHNARLDAEEIHRWIPVSERLPKEPGMYIVFLRCGAELQDPGFPDDLSYVTAMHFDFDQRIWNDGIESYNANLDVVNKPHAYYVTHWQPLPEPPEEV